MNRTTCQTCDSLRGLAEGYKKRLEEKEKVILEKLEIIKNLKGLVEFLDTADKAGLIPADKTD